MNIHVVNPLADDRWVHFAERHPAASPFHQRGWLEALRRTYGYEPLALTTAPPGDGLQDGLVLCRVSSWLTGERLVSLPFADHCSPLLNGRNEWPAYLEWIREECERSRCRYYEARPLAGLEPARGLMQASGSFCVHILDVRPSEDEIFRGLHKDSVQRKIRRAEREGLAYASGRSEELQSEFYHLLVRTRRRHRLPPQPRSWFRNLMECMGDRALIRVARKNKAAIAALLTLRHGSSVVYKYGCSDERFHNLGGVALLFWRLIQESKASGASSIDFGRSDLDQEGLIKFKSHWGASQAPLTYYRHPAGSVKKASTGRESQAVRRIVALLPDAALAAAGRILYRHMG